MKYYEVLQQLLMACLLAKRVLEYDIEFVIYLFFALIGEHLPYSDCMSFLRRTSKNRDADW